MTRLLATRSVLAIGVSLAIATIAVAMQSGDRSRPSAPQRITAITKPSRDLELAFNISGRLMERLVEPGDYVEAGTPLLRLDDREAKLRMKLQELRANSTAAIDAANATHDLHVDELEILKEALADGGANQREVARQQLEVERAKATIYIEELKREEAQLEFEAAAVILEKYTLHAPVSGYIEIVLTEPGETVEALSPVLRLVSTNPLILDAAIPAADAMRLRPGSTVWISMDLPGHEEYRPATVSSLSQVAVGATSQRLVRITLPNPDGLPAGISASVRLDEPMR
ncbi:MAG: efflux RND transporter periplasmic adaptor subunit [Phycisphaerales bacterium JB065]